MRRVEYNDIDVLLCMIERERKDKGRKEDAEKEQEDLRIVYKIENVCFWLPEGFTEADEEYGKARYFSKNRPEKILKEEDGESNFLFQLIQKEPDDINTALSLAKDAIRNNDRTATMYEEGKLIKSNYICAWADYKNFAGNECIYNLLFIIDIGEKRIFGAFNCLFERYDFWKPIVLRILDRVNIWHSP